MRSHLETVTVGQRDGGAEGEGAGRGGTRQGKGGSPHRGGDRDLCLVMILTMIFLLLLCRSTSSTGTETHSKLNLGIFKSDSELCADKNNGRRSNKQLCYILNKEKALDSGLSEYSVR